MDQNLPLVALVDDISDNVRILHHCLKDEPYRFGIAQNARELYTLLKTQKPAIILLDVMLPDEDGFSVLKKLQTDARYAQIPVIFVTALARIEDLVQGFEAGGVDYITKPFNAAEVRMRVKNHLRLQSALEREQELNRQLHTALERVRTLEGIIPICSQCKAVRNDHGYWMAVENYITEHTDALFSHSLCPECATNIFPDIIRNAENISDTKGYLCRDDI